MLPCGLPDRALFHFHASKAVVAAGWCSRLSVRLQALPPPPRPAPFSQLSPAHESTLDRMETPTGTQMSF